MISAYKRRKLVREFAGGKDIDELLFDFYDLARFGNGARQDVESIIRRALKVRHFNIPRQLRRRVA